MPPKPKFPPYCTVIPGRSPETKMHTSLGHAKNAVQGYPRGGGYRWDREKGHTVCGGQVYEWDDEWVLLWDIAPGTWQDDLPWVKEDR